MRWIFISVAMISPASIAETTEDYARMAQTTFAAFMCASWAEMMGDREEAERTFNVGLKNGREFISALEDKPDMRNDILSKSPVGVSWYLGGPSVDFMIGRIFEVAGREAWDDVHGDKTFLDDESQAAFAAAKFSDSNCSLIGR